MPQRLEKKTFVVTDEDSLRLDKYCATQGMQRSLFGSDGTTITVNGKKGKKSQLVEKGDTIVVSYVASYFDGVKSEDIPLSVLYEDEEILVIDKEQGMVVHPASGNWDGTLVNALLGRYGDDFLDEDDSSLRPGIVHRLDKDTSGTMVIARSREAQENLIAQFKAHTTEKVYIAVAKGVFKDAAGTIETGMERSRSDRKKFCVCPPDSGKLAHTEYRVLRQFPDCALLRVHILTGRTHQIRVHLSSIGHPVIGDPIYGNGKDGSTLLLHALCLSFDHPGSGVRMTFRAPLPSRFLSFLTPRLARRNALAQSSGA
jgi:23S rRNA pseudouridine1911/1915/1917 synthase